MCHLVEELFGDVCPTETSAYPERGAISEQMHSPRTSGGTHVYSQPAPCPIRSELKAVCDKESPRRSSRKDHDRYALFILPLTPAETYSRRYPVVMFGRTMDDASRHSPKHKNIRSVWSVSHKYSEVMSTSFLPT